MGSSLINFLSPPTTPKVSPHLSFTTANLHQTVKKERKIFVKRNNKNFSNLLNNQKYAKIITNI